jgi:hypothetical protein
MTALGPAEAMRLELLRSGDRDSQQRRQQPAQRKASRQVVAQDTGEPNASPEFEKDEETHQLDEQA